MNLKERATALAQIIVQVPDHPLKADEIQALILCNLQIAARDGLYGRNVPAENPHFPDTED